MNVFDNKECSEQKRKSIVIRDPRFAENSELTRWREQLRPLMVRGFAGIIEDRLNSRRPLNHFLVMASKCRAEAILGGQVFWNNGQDWVVNDEYEVCVQDEEKKEIIWLISLIFYLTVNETGEDLIIENPHKGLNVNQQKMLSEMLVLYEAADGVVRLSVNDSPYFVPNQVEDIRQFQGQ